MVQKEFMDNISRKLEEKLISIIGSNPDLIENFRESHKPSPICDPDLVNPFYGAFGIYSSSSDILVEYGFDEGHFNWTVIGDLAGEIEVPTDEQIMDVWESYDRLPIPSVKKYGEVIIREFSPNAFFKIKTEDFGTVTNIEMNKPFPHLIRIHKGQPLEDAVGIILDYFVHRHYLGPPQ